jgi:hypothetical protein
LGEADVILNIKLNKNESGITLSQSHYAEKILSQFGFVDGKSSPTPYDPSVILLRDFYFYALRSLVVLSFPQLVSFSSVLSKPLSETLRRSSDGRIPI